MALALICVSVLLLFSMSKELRHNSAWILALPLFATFTGIGYNFEYELVTSLICLVWLILVNSNTETKLDIHILVTLIGLTTVYVCYDTIQIWYNQIAQEKPFYTSLFNRSTFGNANYLAGYLIVIIPLFYMLKRYIFLLIALGTLYLSQSHGAMLACIASLIIISSIRSKLALIVSSIIGLITSIAVYLGYLPIPGGDSISCRLHNWRIAWKSIQHSPLIGHGLGTSYELYYKFKGAIVESTCTQQHANHVHMEILEYMQESGLVGVIILIYVLVLIICVAYRSYKQTDSIYIKQTILGIIGGLLAYALHSMVSVAPRMITVRLPVYTLLGLLFSLNVNKSKASKKLLIPLVIMVVLCYILITPWLLRQYDTAKFVLKPNKQVEDVIKFEKIVYSWNKKDIYGLYNLIIAQQAIKSPNIEKTLGMIHSTIPYYRTRR